MNGEFRIRGAQTSDKVSFECLDAPFSGIASMDARWDKLIFNFFVMKEFFERFRAFIVKALELWSETSFAQTRMDAFVSISDGGSFSIFKGCD